MVCCVFVWCLSRFWRFGFHVGWLAFKARFSKCCGHTTQILSNLYYNYPYAFVGAIIFLTYEIESHPWVIYQVTHFWELLAPCLPDSLGYYLSFKPTLYSSNAGLLAASSDSSVCSTSSNSHSIKSTKRYSLVQDTFWMFNLIAIKFHLV